MAAMQVTTAGFDALAQRVVYACDRVAGGRLVAVLEGGYNLGALGEGLVALSDALCTPVGQTPEPSTREIGNVPNAARAAIESTMRALARARGEAS